MLHHFAKTDRRKVVLPVLPVKQLQQLMSATPDFNNLDPKLQFAFELAAI